MTTGRAMIARLDRSMATLDGTSYGSKTPKVMFFESVFANRRLRL